MSTRSARLCDACDAHVLDSFKNAVKIKRFKGKGHWDFCDTKCLITFFQKYASQFRKKRKYTRRQKIVKAEARSHKGKKLNTTRPRYYNPKMICAMCGMKCRNTWVLKTHIKKQHGFELYDKLTKKTGGAVREVDGTIIKAARLPDLKLKDENGGNDYEDEVVEMLNG